MERVESLATQSFFRIENDSSSSVSLYIEPEGAAVPLAPGEEVLVFDVYTKSPVTLRLSKSGDGETCVSIWPGDGDVRVEKGGVNVLDSM
jgi:hypothetical protein